MQRSLVLLQIVDEKRRNWCIKQFIRFFGIIAGIFQHSDFVFYLNHDNRSLFLIHRSNVFHPLGKSTAIRLKHILRKGTGYFEGLPCFRIGTRVFLIIFLKPDRSIATHWVFPRTEPKENHLQIIRASLLNHFIRQSKIKFTFLWFC